MIERMALSQGGRVASVDPATNTHRHRFRQLHRQVANVIPPQKAGRIAEHRGRSRQDRLVPDRSRRHLPRSSSRTFTSSATPASAARIPKSASAASAQGKACAAAIVKPDRGHSARRTPRLTGTCYNTVAPGYALLAVGQLPAAGTTSSPRSRAASRARSMRRARCASARRTEARAWFKTITVETFG